MTFSERLRLIRGTMTQTAFAKKLGIPQNTYHRYEKDERVPDIRALTKISKSLNMSADELLGLKHIKPSELRNGYGLKNISAPDPRDATIAKQAETIVTLARSLKKLTDKK